MKLVIAGSRSITDYNILRKAIIQSGIWEAHKRAIEVVSGKADGVDTLGEEFASKAGLIDPHEFPANWDDVDAPGAVVRYVKYGKHKGKPFNVLAGSWRNQEMANFADAALVVWDGKSTGSLDMVHKMLALDKPCYLYPLRISPDLVASLEDKGCVVLFPNTFDSGEVAE